MNGNQIYSQLRAKQFRAAFNTLQREWQTLHWGIRGAIAGAVIGLLLLWVATSAGGLAFLLLLPLGVMAWIAMARLEPLPLRVESFARRADDRRKQAAAKGTFFAKWAKRPFHAALSGSAKLTARIGDPYLRAGATVGLQMYAVLLAAVLTYVAVSVVLALVCILFSLWVFFYFFLGGYKLSGGGASEVVSSAVKRSVSGRMGDWSEEREDVFGRRYAAHIDDQGNAVGSTESRENIFGQRYEQDISPKGDYTGRSEERENIFGQKYTQHANAQGEDAGHSEEREDVFGRRYTQHYDSEGNPSGRSEEREDIFGRKYTKHQDE